MQQTGTLKKRRKRNLAKVNGLSQILYNGDNDNFTGLDFFGSGGGNFKENEDSSNAFVVETGSDTRLRLSASALKGLRRDTEHRANSRYSNKTRVTRDPCFHAKTEKDENNCLNSKNLKNSTGAGGEDLSVGLGDKKDSFKEREYFLDKQTMQRLRQVVWLGISTGAFPWKWNAREYRIERWGPFMEKLWWCQWLFVTIQSLTLTGFQLYSFYKGASAANTYRNAFQSSLSFLWYSYAFMYNINMYYYKEPIRNYINSLMRFNHDNVQRYLIHLNNYKDDGKWVITRAKYTNLIQVFVSVSLFLIMPFQPWYLFSYIYPKPWYWLIPGAMQEFVVVGQVITSYSLVSWMIVAHNNTLKFWLRELHNHNDSDYTTDELRSPKIAIETYRSIQVLTKLFNDCTAPLAIPFIKIQISTALIPCGYVLIRSMNHIFIDEFPGILTYPLGVLDCSTCGFVILSMAAEVYDLGCSFVDSWSRTKHKDFRRVLMSCPALKIWVGRFYFLTVTTTITFFNVVFGKITDCLLTFP